MGIRQRSVLTGPANFFKVTFIMSVFGRSQRLAAETPGTALLLATVVGSGIMGETLAGRNVAIALLGNTIATGAILAVLIKPWAGVWRSF